jgi:hypothetical protein
VLGKLPPLKPVPEPRVTTETFELFANLNISAICCVDLANATYLGICCMAAVPSKE